MSPAVILARHKPRRIRSLAARALFQTWRLAVLLLAASPLASGATTLVPLVSKGDQIPDEQVRAVAVEPSTETAWIGTDRRLLRWQTQQQWATVVANTTSLALATDTSAVWSLTPDLLESFSLDGQPLDAINLASKIARCSSRSQMSANSTHLGSSATFRLFRTAKAVLVVGPRCILRVEDSPAPERVHDVLVDSDSVRAAVWSQDDDGLYFAHAPTTPSSENTQVSFLPSDQAKSFLLASFPSPVDALFVTSSALYFVPTSDARPSQTSCVARSAGRPTPGSSFSLSSLQGLTFSTGQSTAIPITLVLARVLDSKQGALGLDATGVRVLHGCSVDARPLSLAGLEAGRTIEGRQKPLSIALGRDTLYVASPDGLFTVPWSGNAASSAESHPATSNYTSALSMALSDNLTSVELFAVGSELLLVGNGQLFRVDPSRSIEVDQAGWFLSRGMGLLSDFKTPGFEAHYRPGSQSQEEPRFEACILPDSSASPNPKWDCRWALASTVHEPVGVFAKIRLLVRDQFGSQTVVTARAIPLLWVILLVAGFLLALVEILGRTDKVKVILAPVAALAGVPMPSIVALSEALLALLSRPFARWTLRREPRARGVVVKMTAPDGERLNSAIRHLWAGEHLLVEILSPTTAADRPEVFPPGSVGLLGRALVQVDSDTQRRLGESGAQVAALLGNRLKVGPKRLKLCLRQGWAGLWLSLDASETEPLNWLTRLMEQAPGATLVVLANEPANAVLSRFPGPVRVLRLEGEIARRESPPTPPSENPADPQSPDS